jgi:GMP synthase (glutamine-hydrolysing)
VLLVRNDPFETFGVAPGALAGAGLDLRTVDATVPDAELPDLHDVSGVVMFGGTVNVDQVHAYPSLVRVRSYTAEALERAVPYLGICLGSQILARAAGTEVVPGPVREVGFEPVRPTDAASEDPLLAFLGAEEMVLQWHEDTHVLPEGSTLLVEGDRIPVQAYRLGDLAWGIQFHLEVDAPELDWWLDVADREIDLEAEWGKSAQEIRDETAIHIEAQQRRGREIFRRFAAVIEGSDHARRGATRARGGGRSGSDLHG